MKTVALVSYIALGALVLTLSPAARADQAGAAPSPSKIVNLELRDTPIKEAIASLFLGTGLKYYIQSGVSGRVVELKLKGITLDQALDALGEAAQLTFKIEDGAYIIGPASKTHQGAGPSQSPAKPQQPMPAEQPAREPSPQPPPAQTGALAGASVGNNSAQVNITNPSPVYYGSPGPYGNGNYGGYGGYGGVPYYQVGSVGILGGYGYGPVVFGGGSPYIIGTRAMPPPPVGYVGPDILRFLRTQYAIQNRTFITYNGY